MTADIPAGAPSRVEDGWHSIDWQQVNQNVRRLQARIVKATQEGRWGKVKALQRLLTHSYSGKALAVRRVTETPGKRMPGVDGATWNTPEMKSKAVQTLKQRGYRPQTLRRVHIRVKNGERLLLGIPTMKDRAMQALYLLALDPVAETTADLNSYGFRSGRSAADAIEQCFTVLSKANCAQWVLVGSIQPCSERISHEWLLAHVPMDKAILRKWLTAGHTEGHVLSPTEEGTLPGSVAAPVLGNLLLNGLEAVLRKQFPKPHTGYNAKVNLVRYAGDLIVTGASKEVLETEVRPLIERFLRERGLELSQEQTASAHIENGFDFLGQHVRKYNGKMLIMPSRKNVKAFLGQVRRVVKANKALPAGHLVLLLNPLIRGWTHYHRHVVSSHAFSSVDDAIHQLLWRWARRRHLSKPARWVQKKYFGTVGGDRWVFHGEANGKDHVLFRATRVSIKRHVKVKGKANPYDPQWEAYFERRLDVRMTATLKGRRQLLRLWKEQRGICPVCEQHITELTGWHNHHIVWRVMGGTDRAENRVLLHPDCHRRVHSQGIYVEKPRPTRGDREA